MLQEQAANSGTPQNCPKKRTSVPICAHVAPSIVIVPKPMHGASLWIWSLQQEKLWGLTTGMNLSDFPTTLCAKAGMLVALTLTVCTRFSCGPPSQRRPTGPSWPVALRRHSMSDFCVAEPEGMVSRPVSCCRHNLDCGWSCGPFAVFLTPGVFALVAVVTSLCCCFDKRPLPFARFLVMKAVVLFVEHCRCLSLNSPALLARPLSL